MSLPIRLPEGPTGSADLCSEYVRLEQAMGDGTADRPPALIVAMPPIWMNKYQVLLYGRAAEFGMTVLGARTPAELESISWPGPVLLHAHWFDSIFAGIHDDTEGREALERAFEEVAVFRRRTEAKLLWTAHNIFPHGNRLPRTFLELRRRIFREFDAVHLMHEDHLPMLEAAYGEKARASFVVPHMTYRGALPDTVDRKAARAHYGLRDDAFVFGFFGSLQAYKGIGTFLDALEQLQKEKPGTSIGAIVAGAPVDTRIAQQVRERAAPLADVRLDARKLADHEVQYSHRAADIMVLPYEETLNSGAALMAVTFGTPFIGPKAASLEELPGAYLGTVSDSKELAELMSQSMRKAGAHNGNAAQKFDPRHVSGMFFEKISNLI